MVASFSISERFTVNLSWLLSYHRNMLFLRGFISKLTKEHNVSSLKNRDRDFQNSPQFERSACFYVTVNQNFERFQYLSFKKIFWKNANLFHKTEVLFLVASAKIENSISPYKTPLSEANVKINRTGSTKNDLPITKNEVLPVTRLFFRKFWISLRILSK